MLHKIELLKQSYSSHRKRKTPFNMFKDKESIEKSILLCAATFLTDIHECSTYYSLTALKGTLTLQPPASL